MSAGYVKQYFIGNSNLVLQSRDRGPLRKLSVVIFLIAAIVEDFPPTRFVLPEVGQDDDRRGRVPVRGAEEG